MTERLPRIWIVLAAATVAWALALLQWGQTLNLDELEFFRATRWIAEGRLPFRDYWEHHLPLQWILFAPISALVSNGPGAAAVLALRWAQLPLWIATFAIMLAIMRRAGVSVQARWAAVILLLTSIWFTRAAVQYRLDVPGHFFYVVALWLIVSRKTRASAFTAGILLALATLANMRLAPLVVITVLLLMFWDEERWVWNPRALFSIAGGILVAGAFVAWLQLSGSMPGFVEGVITYNRTSDSLLPPEARAFFTRLFTPFVQRDLGGALFLLAAGAGLVLLLRGIKRPRLAHILALLGLASLATVAASGIQYEYHFQTPCILLLPLAATAIDRLRPRYLPALAGVTAAGLVLTVVLMLPGFGSGLVYQDRVMNDVDRHTNKNERVWDSTGYALRREPAYRYWFLPAGVRFMADRGLIENYDIAELAANPPAAIIFNQRTQWWLVGRPRMARYIVHHYLPLYQNLWIPGLSAIVRPGRFRVAWTVPRAGHYDVYVSELLAKHPWLARPSQYGLMNGPELMIPLDELPTVPRGSWQFVIDGKRIDPRARTLALRRGAKLEVITTLPRPAGVLVVPHGERALSIMPDSPVPF